MRKQLPKNKLKMLKVNATIWFNKQSLIQLYHVTPKYAQMHRKELRIKSLVEK